MLQKHKKPLDFTPSNFVLRALEKYSSSGSLTPALDIPCGFGRHSILLSKKNCNVLCADYDPDVFRDHWFDGNHDLIPILLDARKELPFRLESFGVIIVVHFYANGLFLKLLNVLKPDGLIIFESIGGQGENWRGLPLKSEFKAGIEKYFNILHYIEKPVGPTKNNITVKMIARKI